MLLAYRLPREPSTPRIAVWSKLRRLGAARLVDGLVALPADALAKEQVEWIPDEILEAGGEATVWVGRPGSRGDEGVRPIRADLTGSALRAPFAGAGR